MKQELKADYVIVGSGAVGMAFADIILTESDATIIIIDRYAKPGGHWNVAYPFVTLHQPSAYYGVSSKELSGGRLEKGGWNDGLGELASGQEVSAYFEDVMKHQFLPSGRVQYFPMCDYLGDGTFISMTSGQEYSVTANKKIVDCTFLKTTVPSTHTPNFDVHEDVRFMPLNDLPTITEKPDGYVVIGAGKTGIDACLWLLQNNVDPNMITWIVNREAWLLNRKNTQMHDDFFFDTFGTEAAKMESIAAASSPDDMFERLEQCGYLMRIDTSVKPEMFHAATVTTMEVEQLRRIKNVVRMGHVTSVAPDRIHLKKGTIPTTSNTVHVDCSACAIKDLDSKEMFPVFQGDLITPQLVRPYQPVFSAAMAAHVELNYDDEQEKNRLCGLVPFPNSTFDFIRFTAAALVNQNEWSKDSDLQKWMAANRLEGSSGYLKTISPDDQEKWAVIGRITQAAPAAAMKLHQFMAEAA